MLSIRVFKTPSTLRQELRFNDTDPVLYKDIWSGLRDPLQLLAGGHRSNEEGSRDMFTGTPGSHNNRRDSEAIMEHVWSEPLESLE